MFDYLTFGALLLFLGADAERFRTTWFIESVLSAAFVVFVLRTRLSFTRSRPARALLVATLGVALVVLLIPYTSLAQPFGFEALDLAYLLTIVGISMTYVLVAEFVKHWFYRRFAGER